MFQTQHSGELAAWCVLLFVLTQPLVASLYLEHEWQQYFLAFPVFKQIRPRAERVSVGPFAIGRHVVALEAFVAMSHAYERPY